MYYINILVKITCYLEMYFVLFGNKTNIYMYIYSRHITATPHRQYVSNNQQIDCLTVCLGSYQKKHRRPYGPLRGESTGDWWAPAQMTSKAGNFLCPTNHAISDYLLSLCEF